MLFNASLRLLLAICAIAPVDAAPPKTEDIVTTGLTDISATVAVVQANQDELEQINRDFGMAYKLKNIQMRYKEPNKLRMDGAIGMMIINGSTRYFRVPKLGLKRKDDLGDAPGKRHSLLDVGLLTRAAVATMKLEYQRDEALNGTTMRVYNMSYKGEEKAHYVLWINPKTRIIEKREWYDDENKLKAVFLYKAPKEISPGVWVPTRIEIINGQGVTAGVTAYTELKVNQGLEDSLFEIS